MVPASHAFIPSSGTKARDLQRKPTLTICALTPEDFWKLVESPGKRSLPWSLTICRTFKVARGHGI